MLLLLLAQFFFCSLAARVCVVCVCVWANGFLVDSLVGDFLGQPLFRGAVRYGSAALSGKQSYFLCLILSGFQWVCLFFGRLVLVRSTLV